MGSHTSKCQSHWTHPVLESTYSRRNVSECILRKATTVCRQLYDLFVPDLLHEFEIGVWKATFAHAIRILFAVGGDKVQELNERFRQVPTFGRDTIRRFVGNMADMKKLGAETSKTFSSAPFPYSKGYFPSHLTDL